jgi:hypothetical protein
MKLFVGISQGFIGNMGINLGCGNIRMTEEHLNTAEIRAV